MRKKSMVIACGCIVLMVLLLFLCVLGMKQLKAIGSTKKEVTVESVSKEIEVSSEEEIVYNTMNTEDISDEAYYEMEEQNDDSTENEIWESEELEDTKEDLKEKTESSVQTKENGYPYYIKVNRQANCVTIYGKDEQGEYTVPVKAMVCSVGLRGNTPLGVFKTSTKYTWRYLYGDVYGQYAYRINGPILFHSVPYYQKDKSTLETEEYNKLGQAASKGCVRLSVEDAKWLIDNCPQGTTVEIYDSEDPGPLGKPIPIRIDTSSANKGWDPTDPDQSNPWNRTIPVLSGVANKTVERCSDFNPLEGISAKDSKGNTLSVKVEGLVLTGITGTYMISYSATDEQGLSVSKEAIITVVDSTNPVIKIKEEFIIDDSNKSQLMEIVCAGTLVTDNGKSLSIDQVEYDLGDAKSAIKNDIYGVYKCSAIVVDGAGNKSDRVYFNVVFADQTAPVIRLTEENLITQVIRGQNTEEQIVEEAKGSAIKVVSSNVTIEDKSFYTNVLQVDSFEKEYQEIEDSTGQKKMLLAKVRVKVKVTVEDNYQNRSEKFITVLVDIQDS